MQVPSQAYPPAGAPAPTPQAFPAQGMPGLPNQHAMPQHSPYPPAQPGAWQHESPPTTPRLQVKQSCAQTLGPSLYILPFWESSIDFIPELKKRLSVVIIQMSYNDKAQCCDHLLWRLFWKESYMSMILCLTCAGQH